MNIFDVLNSLLHSKEKIEFNLSEEKEFNLFIVNRWLSMYSPEVVALLNETVNKWWGVWQTKQEQYNFLHKILPKCKFKRIKYLKKPPADKEKDEADIIRQLSTNKELSVREIKMLHLELEELNSLHVSKH